MFRKIIILIIIFSPVWYSLFIGYPILSSAEFKAKESKYPTISVSKRCFDVGDFGQFIECFNRSKKIKGNELIKSVTDKTNQMSVFVTVVLIISFIVFIGLSITL